MDGFPAAEGLRRRRARQEANGEIPPANRVLQQQQQSPPSRRQQSRLSTVKGAYWYYLVSVILVLCAVIAPSGTVTTSAGGRVFYREPGLSGPSLELESSRNGLEKKEEKEQFDLFKIIQEIFDGTREDEPVKTTKKESPVWIRWLLPPQKLEEHVEKKGTTFLRLALTFIDPTLLSPSPNTSTDIIDKVLKSSPRLLVVANLLLVMTYLAHGSVASFFLGHRRGADDDSARWAGRERLGGFLVFKLLLISAVVAPDTLDFLILLSWYTLLSFLRSLAALASATTSHTSLSGQPPKPGVLHLLILIFMSDVFAAAVCAGLFHGAGWGMVFLLTCDCALLAVDVVCHILRHMGQGMEHQHSSRIAAIEDRQLLVYELRHRAEENHVTTDSGVDINILIEESKRLDRRMEILEARNAKRYSFLETTILFLQLLAYVLTVAHFLHIWSLHGLQFTLIDGVLALHLHSALSAAGKKIAERQNLNRIARDLDGLFKDANDMELMKASASGDVCCICMGTMSTGNIKKVACGHMYHTHCLREVVERARSIEAARCPLCRASVLDGRQPEMTTILPVPTSAGVQMAIFNNGDEPMNEENDSVRETTVAAFVNNNAGGDHALFRFSTEGILPVWLPLPAFSFEVVRRPPLGTTAVEGGVQDPRQEQSFFRRLLLLAGAVNMTPEEEAVAMEQLVDMFPQYNRADLLRELRIRRSTEDVAESVLLGVFTGVPRGAETDPTTVAVPSQITGHLLTEAREWETLATHAVLRETEVGGNNQIDEHR